jgi:hypothetical protein
MKTSTLFNLSFGALLTITTLQCSDNMSGNGNASTQQQDNMEQIIAAIPADDLSNSELESLLFMIEEEKVARDSYVFLGNKFGGNVFLNIQKSEQTHMDAIGYLFDRYELTKPSTLTSYGTFENKDLQVLYDDLTAFGVQSWVDALTVGAMIEEVDILDLQRIVQNDIDNADLAAVYANLISGSKNHLRAFVKNLKNQGIIYSPHYLTKIDYDLIING